MFLHAKAARTIPTATKHALKKRVARYLKDGCSPEQIAGMGCVLKFPNIRGFSRNLLHRNLFNVGGELRNSAPLPARLRRAGQPLRITIVKYRQRYFWCRAFPQRLLDPESPRTHFRLWELAIHLFARSVFRAIVLIAFISSLNRFLGALNDSRIFCMCSSGDSEES